MIRLRTNILFDHAVNIVRKAERDFILDVLGDYRDSLIESEDFLDSAVVDNCMKRIQETTHKPIPAVNDEEGVPIVPDLGDN